LEEVAARSYWPPWRIIASLTHREFCEAKCGEGNESFESSNQRAA
jgi:hypothetical protein